MTREEAFDAIYNKENPVYETIEQIPEQYREEALELIELGYISMNVFGKIAVRKWALQGMIAGMRCGKAAVFWDGRKETVGDISAKILMRMQC